jgi:glycosyltransferase involved in cell wall biosynthesis
MVENAPYPDSSSPYISIIIPVYNSERTLKKCLTAIFSSRFQKFEVLVVDDDSKDNSMTIAESFPCKILKLPYNQGPCVARNWGARNAKGDILLFVDSDVVIEGDTLNLFVDSLESYPAVFGIYTQKPGTKNLLSLYQNFYAHKSIRDTEEHTCMFYSYCAGIKKDIFLEVGGFDETWRRATVEDVQLGLRLCEKGHRIYLNKNIQVVHHANFNIKRFIKNYFYKSLDLSKLMLSKKRLTLNNEGWTNRKNVVSLIAGLSIAPFLISSFFSCWFMLPLVLALPIFMGINMGFYGFIARQKPLAVLNAFFLNLAVQIISAFGIIIGIEEFLREKVWDEDSRLS